MKFRYRRACSLHLNRKECDITPFLGDTSIYGYGSGIPRIQLLHLIAFSVAHSMAPVFFFRGVRHLLLAAHQDAPLPEVVPYETISTVLSWFNFELSIGYAGGLSGRT